MNLIRELPFQYLDICPIIDEKYKVLFKLGSGRYSKVKMGLMLSTNERVAIKIMNHKIQQNELERGYQQKTLSMFLNQVKICLQAKHRNIVQIIDFNVGGVYRTVDGKVRRILYYVMKIAENGQLFRIVNQTQTFTEKTARYIFKQLLAGVKHLHVKGFAHCDIKTQNILIDQKMNVKIADFGFSRQFRNAQKTKISFQSSDAIGSTKCNAPQIMNNPKQGSYHADQIDIFACGCLLFEMVMKAPPFKTSDFKDEYYNKLATNEKNQFWQIFASKCKPSNQFKDLIQKLLNPNPKDRLNIEQIYKHPWVGGETVSKIEYKKQLNSRLKKVLVKVRKQQQSQIKKVFVQERQKQQIYKIEQIQLHLSRQFEDKIRQIKCMLTVSQGISDSSSSNQDSLQSREDQFCPQKTVTKKQKQLE